MKEADQLYKTVGENQEKFDMYQVGPQIIFLTKCRTDCTILWTTERKSKL